MNLLNEKKYPLEYFQKKRNYRWYILLVVLLGAFMSALDLNLMNMINPVWSKIYRQQLSYVEWATLGYQLTLTSLLPVLGRISDIFGRKKFYNVGFLIFIIGSAMVGIGFSLEWIIFWRIIQAIGATFLQSNSIAIISANFPSGERSKAIGIQGAVQATGMALGPTFGGFIVQYFSWNLAFYINVPIGILGTIFALLIIPESISEGEKKRIDYVGASLFTSFLGIFLINFSMSTNHGYPFINEIILYSLSIIFLILFIIHSLRFENPIIDITLLKNIPYLSGNFSGMLSYLIIGGTMFIAPYYMEYGLHYSPSLSGTVLVIIPGFMGIGTPISGFISSRVGAYKLTLLGFSLITISSFLISTLNSSSNLLTIFIYFAMMGFGMGIFTAPNNSSIMGMAPAGKLSMVGGFLNMMRSMGLIFGVSTSTFLLESIAPIQVLVSSPLLISWAFDRTMIVLFIFSILGFVLTTIKKKETKEKFITLPEIG
ncbi:MAG: MFS transporter [Euryarchaeota archaeon]|nr:MFS transporter [Euryarchaeota archaeon]